MTTRNRRWRAVPATVALVTALTAFGAGAASADPGPSVDPQSPTSSDGSVLDPASLNVPDGLTMVPGTAGSGDRDYAGADYSADLKGEVEGTVGVDSVIAPDGRYRTTPTDWHPTTATVQLTYWNGSSHVQFCTGWMIGDDTLMTAGHCVYDQGSGWMTGQGVRAWPARDGSSAPYGSCTAASFHSVNGWTQNGDWEYDYGAIKLNCTVGASTGTYGFWWQSASLDGTSTYVRGYPCDKAYGEQWAHYDNVDQTTTRKVYYQNDTYNCQSGSPVYSYSRSGCGACALGIHAYGTGGGSYNSGTRITEAVFNNMIYWRDL
ncbi:glutamyl endopeptidase [Stackebrandtia albiflava]|uniref:Serine protease n=1 Tax=Stackebrandtia albiflava TaxID=406432 RepID=A0A562URD4_9ACTN|nr:trypsin-like serine protease [Stackebrandtia albiflava]TWJ08167.1 glutamyl endopeptidase [Stackebrandtia albiflava]